MLQPTQLIQEFCLKIIWLFLANSNGFQLVIKLRNFPMFELFTTTLLLQNCVQDKKLKPGLFDFCYLILRICSFFNVDAIVWKELAVIMQSFLRSLLQAIVYCPKFFWPNRWPANVLIGCRNVSLKESLMLSTREASLNSTISYLILFVFRRRRCCCRRSTQRSLQSKCFAFWWPQGFGCVVQKEGSLYLQCRVYGSNGESWIGCWGMSCDSRQID